MGFLREPSHILIVVIVLAVLFGSRRLPDVARGMGQSMRIFKSEVKQMKHDDDEDTRRREPSEPIEGKVVTPRSGQNGATADEPVRETPRNV